MFPEIKKLPPNPIKVKIRELIESGNKGQEILCVENGLTYHTFKNILYRPAVSKLGMKALRKSGLVDDDLFNEYNVWYSRNKEAVDRAKAEINIPKESAKKRKAPRFIARARKINPISKKILRIVKGGHYTYEEICVAAGFHYNTLRTILHTHSVSPYSIQSLKYAGIISEKDEKEYHKWCIENPKLSRRKKRKKRKVKKSSKKKKRVAKKRNRGILLD